MTRLIAPGLSIFFPVHNEISNLEPLIQEILQVIPQVSNDVEIIIVDDGSTDGSSALADRLAGENSCLKVVHHPRNRGYGAALQTGFREAAKDLIFYTDGDRQFDIRELIVMLPLMEDADVLTCYRKKRNDPWHRSLNTKLFELAMKIIFGLRLKDPDCAFKIYRKEVIDNIDMKSTGAMIDVEMLLQAQRLGYRIKQAGVTHLPRTSGVSSGANPGVIFRAIREVFHLWKRLGSRFHPKSKLRSC